MTALSRCIGALLVIAAVELSGCGGKASSPTITGIFVKPTPSNETAYSGQPAPQNQVSFAAYYLYSDGTQSNTTVGGVQWSDSDTWVSLSTNVATCTRPAPFVLGPQLSSVTATVQVNGTTYTDSSGIYCF
jgi:hypothetical protein